MQLEAHSMCAPGRLSHLDLCISTHSFYSFSRTGIEDGARRAPERFLMIQVGWAWNQDTTPGGYVKPTSKRPRRARSYHSGREGCERAKDQIIVYWMMSNVLTWWWDRTDEKIPPLSVRFNLSSKMSQNVKTNMTMISISRETMKPLGVCNAYLHLNATHTTFGAT